MNRIEIHVTQQHIIDAAKHRDEGNGPETYLPSRCCPVSRALRGAFGGSCSSNEISITTPKGPRPTPPAAVQFIKRFDKGQPVVPFSFTLTFGEAA